MSNGVSATSDAGFCRWYLYLNLDDLVENRLVEKGALDDQTNSSELTEQGNRDIRGH